MLTYLIAILLFVVRAYTEELTVGVPYKPLANVLTFTPFLTQYQNVPGFTLCTYSTNDYNKCLHTVEAAATSSIPLRLNCLRRNQRENCINLVSRRLADMVILGEHDYQRARDNELIPVVFARERRDSLYVAVAPQNITLVDFNTAPIDVDVTIDRAFHAAALFNLLRGHNICPILQPAQEDVFIKIVDSADYTPQEDEILLCPNKTIAQFSDFRTCNFEARLQRAVFASRTFNSFRLASFKNLFDTILRRFGDPPNNVVGFNFFAPFENNANVLFNDNTVAFDSWPTYLNNVNEELFKRLHCDDVEGPHDPHQLE